MVETIKKLLVNVQQHFTEAEKLQGRANLGCAAEEDIPTDVVKYTSQNLTDAQKDQGRMNLDAAKNALASSSNNGLMSSTDKAKLDAIQEGAEANVQSDWNQTDSSADDYIKNKPNIDYTNWNADGSLEFDQQNRKIRVHPNLTVVSGPAYNSNNGTYARIASFGPLLQSTINHKGTHLELAVTDYLGTWSGLFVVDIIFYQERAPEVNGYWVYADGITTNGIISKFRLFQKGGTYRCEFELWVELKSYIPSYNFISLKGVKNFLVSNHRTSSNGHVFYPDYWKFNGFVHTGTSLPDSSVWTEVTLQKPAPEDNAIQHAIDNANVQSDWTASNGAAVILNKPEIGYKGYGAQSVTEATSLVVDGDEPAGITNIKVNGGSKGSLISGPYKTLLDSGVGGSKGDVDHGIFIDANGVFQACTNAVLFKCTLSTTFAELKAAISAGKVPFLVTASKVIPMCSSSGSAAWFTDVSMSGNLLTVGAHSYVLTSSGWAEYPKSINNNNSIHIPSCITAKATIAVQDAYAEWMRIGTLIIGGRGSSSGSISIGVKASISGSYKFLTDSTFRTKNTNASGSLDNSFEASSVTVSSAQWNTLRTIDQYSGTTTVNCTYDINMFDTSSSNPSCFNIKIHKLYDGQSSKLYILATESWGSMT